MGRINDLAAKIDAPVISADATSIQDLEDLIDQAVAHLGGPLDFVLHSIGMSVNVRKGKHYTDLNHDWMTKGWDVSAVSFHKLLQTLYKKDAMKSGGSIVALTYIAAQRIFPNYNDMADNKGLFGVYCEKFWIFYGKRQTSTCEHYFSVSYLDYRRSRS